jgi:predicted nucleic-acid-binding Zn-ribbon protein
MAHCPKCNGSMSEGFIVDHGDYGTAHVSTFPAGQPRKSFWTGLKQNKEEQVAVTTLRCGRCGYLESYAKG